MPEMNSASPVSRSRPGTAQSSIADEVLAKAEAVIDRLSAEYIVHAVRDLEELERFAGMTDADGMVRRPHYGEISRIAHDIRGQGAVFGYPLVTRLAGSLCRAMRSLGPHDRAMTTILDSHIAGIRALLIHGITGAEDRGALAIAAGLELLVESRTARR